MAQRPNVTVTATEDSDARAGARRAAALYRVLECQRPLGHGWRMSLDGVTQVTIGRGAGVVAAAGKAPARRIAAEIDDARMSSSHVRLERQLSWVLHDCGSKNGTVVNGTRQENWVLSDGDVIELGRTFFLFREDVPVRDDAPASPPVEPVPGLATLVPEFAQGLSSLARSAASRVPVLLLGESGVGKELAARAVHAASGRKGPLVAVNCGALPDALVESELFGYRKGAFSGAAEDRTGLVRAADGGTLFLDEIGDLREASQAALLRVLQEQEVTPLGATKPIPVDLRIVAATHRDLAARVAANRFRGDLHARLAGFQLMLPPLRERREDLGLLAGAILRRLGCPEEVELHPALARAFFSHAFAGNVRELERVLAAAAVLAGDGTDAEAPKGRPVISLEHAPTWFTEALAGDPASVLAEEDRARRDRIVALLDQHGGNVAAVARAMGKARMQVQRWMKRYKIERDR